MQKKHDSKGIYYFTSIFRFRLYGLVISERFFSEIPISRIKNPMRAVPSSPQIRQGTQKNLFLCRTKNSLFNLTRFSSQRQGTKTAEMCSHSVPLPDYTPGRVCKTRLRIIHNIVLPRNKRSGHCFFIRIVCCFTCILLKLRLHPSSACLIFEFVRLRPV